MTSISPKALSASTIRVCDDEKQIHLIPINRIDRLTPRDDGKMTVEADGASYTAAIPPDLLWFRAMRDVDAEDNGHVIRPDDVLRFTARNEPLDGEGICPFINLILRDGSVVETWTLWSELSSVLETGHA